MKRSHVVAALGGYVIVVAIVFAFLWANPTTDDYAGWAPVTALLALPAVLVILSDPPRARHRHVCTVALPVGTMLGSITIVTIVRLIRLVDTKQTILDLLGFTTFGGLALMIGFAGVVWWYLVRKPLRVGAAQVLKIIVLVGAVTLFLGPVWSEFWALGGIALGWAAAPAIALLDAPRKPAVK